MCGLPTHLRSLLAGLLLCLALGARASALDPENCLYCHGLQGFAAQDSAGLVHNFYINPETWGNTVHGRLACRQCHTDVDQVPHTYPVADVNCTVSCHIIDPYTGQSFSHKPQGDLLALSVHGPDTDSRHAEEKPVCKDCHTNQTYREEAPPELKKAEAACLACHEGFTDLDQKMKHLGLHLSGDEYWRHQQNYNACVRCHTENELLPDSLQSALLDDDMVSSFLSSFHGRGYRLGDTRSPVCSSCHGSHSIFPHDDERSNIHPLNLQQTCSTVGCHEGATQSFATQGSMHELYSGWKAGVLVWVKRIYILLIVGTIGGMLLHNLLEMLAHRRHTAHLPPPTESERKIRKGKVFLRMTGSERVSHILMFTCFSLLALSGGLLWLPDATFAGIKGIEPTVMLAIRAWAHRIAAVLMTLVSLWHIGYTLLTRRGRELLRGLLPRPRDLVQVWNQFLWMLGRRKQPVRFGFFNYGEKMEYWSFAWGTIVMSATGLILWAEQMGPKYIVDVARLVHSMEAILAVCAIVVWHFWNVHWKPGRWPMSEVWITGKIDREQMEEEHGAVLDFIETGTMPWACPVSDLVEEDLHPHNRRDDTVSKPVLQVLGWSMVGVTILSCLVMAWSFTRFLRGTENDPAIVSEKAAEVVLADMRITAEDPSHALASVDQDPDWRYERFHESSPVIHSDPAVKRSECLMCHSSLAHSVNREVRAALNMHSRFMACEVCHSPEDSGGTARVLWADLRLNPQGDPGAPYGLDRHPFAAQENWHSVLVLERDGAMVFEDQTSTRAVDYRVRRPAMDDAEQDRMTELFHDGVAPLADRNITCDACHSPKGMLDFPALGFSPERDLQLQSLSNASSVTNYEQFFLPAVR